ncbi:MAG TPA: ABC transporter permease, partial [Inquilinus sp.]|nr:ABC transporter permease [Inquilinus sp.]
MPNLNYVAKRLIQLVPTLILVMLVIFVLVRLLPGDPTSAMLGDRATDADVARLNAQLGLDQSIPMQFLVFLERIVQGDLGTSIHLKVPVMRLILDRMPVTLALTGFAAILALLMAVPLAFVAAMRRGR